MSELDIQMQVRVNSTKRDKFNKIAKSYGLTGAEFIRVMMDAATDKTLRIIITEKTHTQLKGVHIHV